MVWIQLDPTKFDQAKQSQTFGILLDFMLVTLSNPKEHYAINSMESNGIVLDSMVLVLCIYGAPYL